MSIFRKNVKGLDFEFEKLRGTGEQVFLVRTENHFFTMQQEKGTWRIVEAAPIWIRELQEELGESIEARVNVDAV